MKQPRWLMAAMIGSVVLVSLVMLLDEQREFDSAVDTLREEQQSLATAIAADLESRLRRAEEGTVTPAESMALLIPQLLGGAIELNQPRSRIVLVATPAAQELFRVDGKSVASGTVRAAIQRGTSGLTLDRQQSADLGLAPRIAVVAIRSVRMQDGVWSVIVIASAERLRARERHAQLRFLLGVLVVTALVIGFGGLALRDQRRKLQVARELEVAALQRERERLLGRADKMATLAALSSGIAHQIATPLSTIVARVEQVLPAVSNVPKATAALDVVAQQVARIQRIISGLLDLARGNRPTLVHTQPATIVHGALSLVQHRLAEASLFTELQVDPELPGIACDPPMLEQALANLLLNACDASSAGSTILVGLRASQGALLFLVEDEGEGIADETAARAKEPFFTTKSKQHGTGLGLAIAQEIVANHGGKLHLERRADKRGTRASIELPTTT